MAEICAKVGGAPKPPTESIKGGPSDDLEHRCAACPAAMSLKYEQMKAVIKAANTRWLTVSKNERNRND